MKHTLKLTAMLAAVLMLAACNKEKELTPDTVATTQERDITYTVADRTTTVHLETDTEFEALLVQFCNYAQQGDSVTFYNANRGNKGVAAKDVATYSTTNREEMIRWMRQMEEAGKTVTITYDPNTGSYNGMAYSPGTPPPNPSFPYNDRYPFNGTYVPLEELLVNGVWETSTDTSGYVDFHALGDVVRSYGVTEQGSLLSEYLFVLPNLRWADLTKTLHLISDFDGLTRRSRVAISGDIMHVTKYYLQIYDDEGNYLEEPIITDSIENDFRFEVENECRIRLTPLTAGWPAATDDHDYKVVICSHDRNSFVTVYDYNHGGFLGGLNNQQDYTLTYFRRVR
jgi:hypothetical protein